MLLNLLSLFCIDICETKSAHGTTFLGSNEPSCPQVDLKRAKLVPSERSLRATQESTNLHIHRRLGYMPTRPHLNVTLVSRLWRFFDHTIAQRREIHVVVTISQLRDSRSIYLRGSGPQYYFGATASLIQPTGSALRWIFAAARNWNQPKHGKRDQFAKTPSIMLNCVRGCWIFPCRTRCLGQTPQSLVLSQKMHLHSCGSASLRTLLQFSLLFYFLFLRKCSLVRFSPVCFYNH